MKELFNLQIPLASRPENAVNGVIKLCSHCSKNIVLKRWDSWNNFLVRCPFCNKIVGTPWKSIKNFLLISFIFNAFSFFLTMRFSRAAAVFILFVILAAFGNYLFAKETLPQLLEVLGVVLFLIAPVIINGAVFLNHNSYVGNKTFS